MVDHQPLATRLLGGRLRGRIRLLLRRRLVDDLLVVRRIVVGDVAGVGGLRGWGLRRHLGCACLTEADHRGNDTDRRGRQQRDQQHAS